MQLLIAITFFLAALGSTPPETQAKDTEENVTIAAQAPAPKPVAENIDYFMRVTIDDMSRKAESFGIPGHSTTALFLMIDMTRRAQAQALEEMPNDKAVHAALQKAYDAQDKLAMNLINETLQKYPVRDEEKNMMSFGEILLNAEVFNNTLIEANPNYLPKFFADYMKQTGIKGKQLSTKPWSGKSETEIFKNFEIQIPPSLFTIKLPRA